MNAMNEFVKPTLVLAVICLVITMLLSISHEITQPIIEENDRKWEGNRICYLINVPISDSYQALVETRAQQSAQLKEMRALRDAGVISAPQDGIVASIVTPAWGADFGDPVNFLGQQVYNDDNAFFAGDYGHYDGVTDEETLEIFQTYADMVNAAKAITDDMDARYEAFAEAEAYLLGEALLIPTYAEVSWQLTCVNDYSKIYAPYGNQASRYINWETNSDIYTTEDYAQFEAAFNAE